MRTIIRYIFSLTTIVFLSCDCLSTNESISPIVETKLPSTTTSGTTVSFKIYHVVFNGCGEFSRFKTTRDDRTITIKAYGKYPTCKMCPDNIPTLETNYTFEAKEKGDYYFRFYQNNYDGKEFMFDTLIVQ